MTGAPLLTKPEVAALLRVSLRTLDRIPPARLPRIKYGYRTVRYDRRDVDAYIQQCREAA